jgi:hypothetical protein
MGPFIGYNCFLTKYCGKNIPFGNINIKMGPVNQLKCPNFPILAMVLDSSLVL